MNVKKTYQNDHKKWPTIFREKKFLIFIQLLNPGQKGLLENILLQNVPELIIRLLCIKILLNIKYAICLSFQTFTPIETKGSL